MGNFAQTFEEIKPVGFSGGFAIFRVRVGFWIFFSGSGRVRVSKKASGRVGFSGFRVPDTSLGACNFSTQHRKTLASFLLYYMLKI